MYLGLLAIILGGGLAAAFNIVESNGRTATRTMIQTEGNFLLAKINWAMSGVSVISEPNLNASSAQLSVNKETGQGTIPLTITLVSPNLLFSRDGGATSEPLNNSNVFVDNTSGPIFSRSEVTGQGINPDSVSVAFTVSAHTPNGQLVSADFSNTYFLRK